MEQLTFNVDLKKLSEVGLTPNDYCAIYMVHRKVSLDTPYFNTNWEQLQTDGWIKITENSITPRAKFISLISDQEATTKVSEWVDEWIGLWPEGVKGGSGKYVKSNRVDVLNKLNTFVKKYKKYTKNQIIEATKFYLEDRKTKNWAFIQEAHYFISKDGISALAAAIDNLDKREQSFDFYTKG